MAQGQMNLTAGIVVDTSQLKVGLATARAEVTKFTADLRKAIKIGDPAGIAAAQKSLLGATRSVESFTAALQRNTRAVAVNTGAVKGAEVAFGSMERTVSLLHSKYLLATGAVTGLAAAILKLTKDSAESVDNIEDMSQALGITREEFLRVRQAMINAGVPLDEINQILLKFSATTGKAQQDLLKARGEIGQTSADVTVLGRSLNTAGENLSTFGDAGAILRGGEKPVQDLTNAFTKNQVTLESARGGWKSFEEQLTTTIQTISKIPDAAQKSAAFQEFFARGFTKLTDLPDQLKALEGVKFPAPSATDTKNANDYIVAWNALTTAITHSRDILGQAVGEALVPSLNQMNTALKENEDAFKSWAQTIKTEITNARDNLTINWGPFFTDLAEVNRKFRAVMQSIHEGIMVIQNIPSSVLRALRSGAPVAAGPPTPRSNMPEPVEGQAGGGYISGTGTGTSDSIPALLSNGEFVVNAASVRRLGPGLLHRLNRFANGGYAGDFDPSLYDFDPENTGSRLSSLARAIRAVDQPGVKWGQGNRWSGRLARPNRAEQFGPLTSAEMIKRLREILLGPSAGQWRGIPIGGFDPSVRFAAGGLVGASSGGGRPVHLHLGSSSFALSGSSGVVDALVSHAHGQQMRSAGVKPSWFAGRPSGR